MPKKIQKFIYWEGFIIVGTDKGEIMAWKVEDEEGNTN